MRTIKFRGYNKKNKKWLYGYYLTDRGEHFVCPDERAEGKTWDDYVVDPDSVGQFTGLLDKDGLELYEGDIVESAKDRKKHVIVFRSGMFYASVNEFNPGVYGGFPLWFMCEPEQPCLYMGVTYKPTK